MEKDQICGAIFITTLNLLTVNTFTASRPTIDKEAERWLEAAERCREARDIITFGYADAATINSLSVASERLETIGKMISQDDNPRILSRTAPNKGDDILKSHARSIALNMHHFFDSFNYGLVAKIISIGWGVEPEITRKSVENWCESLDPGTHRVT